MAGPIATSTTNFSSILANNITSAAQLELRSKLVYLSNNNATPMAYQGRGHTGTFVVPRVADIPHSDTPTGLTEGSPPAALDLSIGYSTVAATQYGAVVTMTDLASLEAPVELVSVASERIARNAADTADTIVRNLYQNTAVNVFYAGTVSTRATVAGKLLGAELQKLVARLRDLNVQPFADGYFRAIMHERQAFDLRADTATGGWVDTLKYTNAGPLLAQEIGQFAGCRVQATTQAPVFGAAGAAGVDVLRAVVFGPNALYFGDLQTVSAHIVLPGGDHTDPLGQLATVGWKAAFGAMLPDTTNNGAGAKYAVLETS